MERFTASDGTEYILKLTLGGAMRVQDELSVDLLSPHEPSEKEKAREHNEANPPIPLALELSSDDVLLANIAAILCSPKDKLTFFDSLDGAAMASLSKAFFKEYETFFGERGQGTMAMLIRTITEQLNLAQNQEIPIVAETTAVGN